MAVAWLSASTNAGTNTTLAAASPASFADPFTFRLAFLFVADTGAHTLPNSNWTSAFTTTTSLGGTGRLTVAYRWEGVGVPASQSFSWPTSARAVLRVNNYTGVDILNPFDIAPAQTNVASNTTGTAITGADITPPSDPAYGIWAWFQSRASAANTGTITAPAGFDLSNAMVNPTTTAGEILRTAAIFALPAGVASGTKVATGDASGAWRSIALTLRAAPEPGRRLLLAA